MIIFLFCINSFKIDDITNKKIIIHSIPYTNYILTENLSDFSPNIFHTKNITYNLKGYNKISRLEKFNNKYRIKIGNYYVCTNNINCTYNSITKMCMNNLYIIQDCDVCRSNSIKYCKSEIDLWDIEKSILGYLIKKNDMCLTLGYKLYLDTCKESKDQIFGFENYELQDCLESINPYKKIETRRDFIDNKKMEDNLKYLKKTDLKKYNKIIKNINNLKNKDSALEKYIPGIRKKKKMRKLWGKLWKQGFKKYRWPRTMKFKMLCTNWW